MLEQVFNTSDPEKLRKCLKKLSRKGTLRSVGSRVLLVPQDHLRRDRQRVLKFLHSKGPVYRNGSHWTKTFRDWAHGLEFLGHCDQETLSIYLDMVEFIERRPEEINNRIGQLAETEAYRDAVSYLRAFRGVATQTAMTVVAELGDLRRFEGPRELMGYLGLVPSEHSSGESEKRGSITKVGNSKST